MRNIVVLISGKQGSGKSTLQNKIISWMNIYENAKAVGINFADPLYELQDVIVATMSKYVHMEHKKYGKLLQYLGTEFGRQELGQDIWVKIAANKCDSFFNTATFNIEPIQLIVFGDTRFKNELDIGQHFYKPYEVIRIRLEAPSGARKKRCQGWRDTENHLSETDLDTELHRFDLVLDTSEPKEKTWELTRAFLFGKGIILSTSFPV